MTLLGPQRILRGAILRGAALLCVTAAPLAAAERRPVPALTIYPGDIIRDGMLTEAEVPDAAASAAYAANRTVLLGKVARRTLLPGQAIPTAAVGEPKVVTIGARVRLVYREDGLLISTYGSALQAGAVGDVVSVRNLDSGITVSGTVAADGSVHIGGQAGADQAGAGQGNAGQGNAG